MGHLENVEATYRKLRAVASTINRLEQQHSDLIELRRKLVAELLALGESKAKISRAIGRSYMVVTQDLKATKGNRK